MSEVASYQERQDEEYQALESIFGTDLEDLRLKVAWKVARPLELRLTLKPQQSMGGQGEVYAQVDLVVKCPPRYPDVVPEIVLENWKGLSNSIVAELKAQLLKEAAGYVGEVMLWQLATYVQEFLHIHNKPPPKSFYEQMMTNNKQQQERMQEQERKKQEEQRREIEQEALLTQEMLKNETRRRREDQKHVEAITPLLPPGAMSVSKGALTFSSPMPIVSKYSSRESKDVPFDFTPVITPGVTPVKSTSTPAPSLQAPGSGGSGRKRRTSTPRRTDEDELGTSPCKDHAVGVATLSFKNDRAVQRGKCLGHGTSGSTVYASMDLASGEFLAVAEWILKWKHASKRASGNGAVNKNEDSEAEKYLKMVAGAEQEFNSLQRLNHPNLIHYLAWRHQCDVGKITVHLLMEYSGGTSLDVYARSNNAIPLVLLQSYLQGLLQALKYLHYNSIVHKNLRPSSIFVDSVGKVRLADYSIDKRLGDLYKQVDRARPGVHFSDERPMVIGRGGQKGDIYQLGLMILTVLSGQPLMEAIPDIPNHLPQVLQDFLNKCLLHDERLRWTAAQLLEHSFLKEPLHQLPTFGDAAKVKDHVGEKTNGQESDDKAEEKEEEDFDYLSSLVASGQSRLASEFDLLKVLGKGGFGDVLKVKNKLDGRFYAIKRIPLNPKSKAFNKKMKREVKLLSRLNHENVVRYYCSWIEISDDIAQSETSSSRTPSSLSQMLRSPQVPQPTPQTATTQGGRKGPHIVRSIPLTKTPVLTSGAGIKSANCSFDPIIGDVDNLVPRVGDESVEWLTSFDKGSEIIDSSSDEEEDEADVFGTSFMPKMDRSEESVLFDTDESPGDNALSKEDAEVEASIPSGQEADSEPEELTIKILYIQMEYCEKSTLRTCIDAGLCSDQDRMWRLFREIIDGLVHIHGQGMIHRDLKPVNIFLDSQDHVKIGDFGLATDILVKDQMLSMSRSGLGSGDGNLTGKVGTALYVSPEVMQGGGKVHYNQQVDIYSLGIIFFEMCYKSLPTGMERVKIISNLRLPSVELPEDFDKTSNKEQIIRWLLDHNPSKRPSSKELLASELLPRPHSETEYSEMVLRSTVANPSSSSYRHLLHAIFNQSHSIRQDLFYDHEMYEHIGSLKDHMLQFHVESTLSQVFLNHGAIQGPNLPTFLPKCGLYENSEQHVRMMDQRGGIVSLPLDLRVPFARYVGRHNIQAMKRFSIEKVFKERKFISHYNMHPWEPTECAFDIITTSGSLIPDAEVLSIVQEIINKYPALQTRNYYVRINHMSVLRAVLLHCGIPENVHSKALALLAENNANKKKGLTALETDLGVKLSEQVLSQLSFLIETEGTIGKVSSILRCITKTMGLASSLAKSGLHDLEHIISHAHNMGLKLQVIVTVGFVYNPHQYSGVLYQVMCDYCKKKKRKVVTEVLAAGGRYDKLIEKFTPVQPLSSSHIPVHGVGISISFDRLVSVIKENEQILQHLSPCDVLVCTVGHHLMVKERLAVAKDLWASGFRTDLLFDRVEDFDELQENCLNRGISHIVVLEQSDITAVKGQLFPFVKQKKPSDHHGLPGDEPICFVKSVQGYGPLEKVAMHDIVEFLTTKKMDQSEPLTALKTRDCCDSSGHVVTSNNSNTNNTVGGGSVGSGSNSNSSNPGGGSGGSTAFNYNIVFVFQDSKKYTGAARRRHEALIAGKASTQYPWLPIKNLEVLALDMPSSGIRTIISHVELNDKNLFEESIGVVMEKLSKLRKYLVHVFEQIHDLRFVKQCNFILLYSIKDETLKIITP
ncbi:hypothetical protein RRG08_033554 [Elysia crispata]|uniref:non-specific serine/threonine protein kinase n=1 Tax=Elysia crispata TaxID=231223 RepID=A0AAE0XNT6_9GAST|nr:hypothetical protein RRG08_033554 [Elysia crispata]